MSPRPSENLFPSQESDSRRVWEEITESKKTGNISSLSLTSLFHKHFPFLICANKQTAVADEADKLTASSASRGYSLGGASPPSPKGRTRREQENHKEEVR